MNNEIKKIVLDLNGKEVELTLEQAKSLHKLLDQMFGEKVISTYPIFVERPIYTPHWRWQDPTWCDVSTNINMSYSEADKSVSFKGGLLSDEIQK